MFSRSALLLLAGIVLTECRSPPRIPEQRQNIKVRINATGDTIILKFVKPNSNVKLEGYILGYGRSMLSKQFIPLPENGIPYETEMDAEPKYLIVVQPIPSNDAKKHCKGKVDLEKVLDLAIGSVTPTSVLLSWGNLQKTPYDGNIMNDCLEDGHYTVRYRERNRKWNYQTCPTSDTVIDNLKPNTPYEFGVRSNKEEKSGVWSKPVIHSTNKGEKGIQKLFRPKIPNGKPVKSIMTGSRAMFPPRLAIHNRTRSRGPLLLQNMAFPASRSTFGSSPQRPPLPIKTNLVDKPGDKEKTSDLKKTDKASILRHNFPSVTAKPAKQDRKQTSTAVPAHNDTQFDTWENSSLFSSVPSSEVDAMGKKRFIAPHVVYKTDKKPNEPCSITSSLNYFPEDEAGEQNVTGPPRASPSNLTVVAVEGCPSFVILDWQRTDNETTGYEVISTTKGPDGEEVNILTTNQTHTAVENLKPERSYEFSVKPMNPHGSGPQTDPVEFNTESADPRVSENVSGKDAIWTQFPFKSDAYSDCHGKQYVKRTWYRKFVGIQLCNSLRYKIYLSDSLTGKFHNIGDQTGHGEDHCQFVDSFLDGWTGTRFRADQLPSRTGYYRSMRQEPVSFGEIGGNSHINYVAWYECGTPIPGKW